MRRRGVFNVTNPFATLYSPPAKGKARVIIRREAGETDVVDLAKEFAAVLQAGSWIFLEGDLGAGKTHFVGALARELGITEQVSSPTFSLVQVMPLPRGRAIEKLIHLDLYRIKNPRELLYLGLELEDHARAVTFVEWASRVESEGWDDFFEITGCPRPQYWLEVNVEHGEGTLDHPRATRTYRFSRRG